MSDTALRKSRLDLLIAGFDQALRTAVDHTPQSGARPYPAPLPPAELAPEPARQARRLMRVNHAGEVCAQALYLGQALLARTPRQQQVLQQAADEEQDHLVWCRQRLSELGAGPSKLSVVWFGGAYVIGVVAGLAGDKLSLGFLAETEHQVVAHLNRHLQALPAEDATSRAIVMEMRTDEAQHASTALREGAVELPPWIKKLMALQAKVMTTIAALV